MKIAARFVNRQRQSGAAVLEFALVMPLLIMLVYGLIAFGLAFYTQVVLSRAAEDGARSVSFLTNATTVATIPATVQASIKNEVINSLANSNIVPSSAGSSYTTRRTWLVNNVLSNIIIDNASCGGGGVSASTLRVRFDFPYSLTRIVAPISLPLVGSFRSWMPDTLSACANVQL